MYKCVGVLNDMRLEAGGPPEERFYNLSVKKVELPLFLTSQHPENLIANYSGKLFKHWGDFIFFVTWLFSEKFDILCQPSGKPDPDCSWYKDGKELAVTTTRSGVELTDGKREILLLFNFHATSLS